MNSNIRLGVSPLSWMNADFPSIGAEAPIAHCLSEAALIGYEGVEYEHPFLKEYEKMPQLLHDRKLRCVGGWLSTHLLLHSLDKEIEELKKHIAILKHMRASIVIFGDCSHCTHRQKETPLIQRPILSPSDWKPLSEGLDCLSEIALENGLDAVYHPHVGTVIQSAEEAEELMERTRHLGLLFDPGHLVLANEDPMQLFHSQRPRIRHLQLKNVRGSLLRKAKQEKWSFLDAVLQGIFTVPGDESDPLEHPIPWDEICSALTHSGYEGWIMIEAEQDPSVADPFRYAQLGYRTISQLIHFAQREVLSHC